MTSSSSPSRVHAEQNSNESLLVTMSLPIKPHKYSAPASVSLSPSAATRLHHFDEPSSSGTSKIGGRGGGWWLGNSWHDLVGTVKNAFTKKTVTTLPNGQTQKQKMNTNGGDNEKDVEKPSPEIMSRRRCTKKEQERPLCFGSPKSEMSESDLSGFDSPHTNNGDAAGSRATNQAMHSVIVPADETHQPQPLRETESPREKSAKRRKLYFQPSVWRSAKRFKQTTLFSALGSGPRARKLRETS